MFKFLFVKTGDFSFCSLGGQNLKSHPSETNSAIVLHYSSHLFCSAYTAEARRSRRRSSQCRWQDKKRRETEWGWMNEDGEQEEWREWWNEKRKGQGGRISHVSIVLTFLSASSGNEYPQYKCSTSMMEWDRRGQVWCALVIREPVCNLVSGWCN